MWARRENRINARCLCWWLARVRGSNWRSRLLVHTVMHGLSGECFQFIRIPQPGSYVRGGNRGEFSEPLRDDKSTFGERDGESIAALESNVWNPSYVHVINTPNLPKPRYIYRNDRREWDCI
ncbi:uncharacterized protein LOC143148393 [Ptiloglossa arizonensis]|uniref:uncharacterized protein LOC143148393 n=1 Tax=Ptiloglossa arizonensis TaxID=3350558 RepID=UPI003F9F0BC2